MQEIEQTLDSREVAEMVKKDHSKLLRDIRTYIEHLAEAKIGFSDFFKDSEYKDAKGEIRPCYRITKKGCEFIAHKMTGQKGTEFTARYINRFHEMQDILSQKEVEPELPWFIRRFRGGYIMLFRDFKSLTGVEICGNYTAWERPGRLQGGYDYNGWAWHTTINREEFKKEYGFDYGDDDCMMYLYLRGIKKALEIYRRESGRKLNQKAYDMIMDGVNMVEKLEAKKKEPLTVNSKPLIQRQEIVQVERHQVQPIQITITLNEEFKNLCKMT